MAKNKNDENHRLSTARMVEILTRVDHISKKELYWQNFVRGMFVGAGSVLGATLLIALFLWLLSLFDTLPLLGPMIENVQQTIRDGTNSN